MNKFFWMSPSFAQYLKLIFAAISFFAVFSTLAFSQSTNSTASTSVTSALCKIYNTIRNVIFLLGLTLAILGGAIYAASGMIIGGVLGVAIAVAAPYILNLIVQANQNSILTGTGVAGANGLCASASII
jgi:hypothetical protein